MEEVVHSLRYMQNSVLDTENIKSIALQIVVVRNTERQYSIKGAQTGVSPDEEAKMPTRVSGDSAEEKKGRARGAGVLVSSALALHGEIECRCLDLEPKSGMQGDMVERGLRRRACRDRQGEL